ncbi:MAG: SGNH/GDSL hydrolase family protein [Isosphaeraceae bacterium]
MRRIFLLAGLLTLAGTNGSPGGEPSRFALNDGDRIVLVGDTLIERDQRYGYLETLLTLSHPGTNLTFRNLGWSGDTVAGLSRAGFDPPEAGYRQLIEQVLAARPTVLIVGYGMAESFDGEAGLPRFVSGLNKFLDAVASTRARVVLLSPIAHAILGPPWPDPSAHNAELARYTNAIAEVARARGAWFIDLFEPSRRREADRAEPPISDDGVVLNETGYRYLAGLIARGLDPSASAGRAVPRIELKPDGAVGRVSGARVAGVERTGDRLGFRLTREALGVPGDESGVRWIDPAIVLAVPGLPEGRYELRADGRRLPVDSRPAEEWARGVRISGGPDLEQVERLRATINRKNRLFFHRWRPQNITYLFGFRKHEQGRNAVEIPQFDPLVAEQEARIARLHKPEAHDYELVRVGEADAR